MIGNRIKNRLKGSLRQAALIRYILAGFIAAVGLTVSYRAVTPFESSNAGYLLSAHQRVSDFREATRRAVIKWMEENSHMPQQVLSSVYGAALKSVNPDLVLAICLVESNFNPRAESDKGAVGLMGVVPDVWLDELKEHGIVRAREDLYSISDNIASGGYVLERYIAASGNLREALLRYSGGDSEYAGKVMRAFGKISMARRQDESIPVNSVRN